MPSNRTLWDRLLLAILVLAPIAAAALFLYVVAQRVTYPYELEWLEGGVLGHVERIAGGAPIYGPPSVDFTPFLYPPLYPYVSYVPWTLFGGGFLPLRLIALLSTITACVVVALLAAREARVHKRIAGVLSAGLLLASFQATGAWFDLARVDMLMVALFVGGVWFIRARSEARLQAAGGVLLGLAFFAKQTALPMAAPLVVWAMLAGRGGARFAAGASFALVVVGGCILIQSMTDGWFGYYVFEIPALHPLDLTLLPQLLTTDFFPQTIPVVLFALWLCVERVRSAPLAERLFLPAWLLGCVGAAWLGRLHSGGYVNVLIPAYLGFSLVFGPAVESLLARGVVVRTLAVAAAVVQFGLLAYDPRPMVPSPADRAAGDALVAGLKATDGDVYIPAHGYLAAIAGHPPFAHLMAVGDVIRAEGVEGRALEAELKAAFNARRFALVILDEPWMVPYLSDAYVPAGRALPGDGVFTPVTGAPVRPEMVLKPMPPRGP